MACGTPVIAFGRGSMAGADRGRRDRLPRRRRRGAVAPSTGPALDRAAIRAYAVGASASSGWSTSTSTRTSDDRAAGCDVELRDCAIGAVDPGIAWRSFQGPHQVRVQPGDTDAARGSQESDDEGFAETEEDGQEAGAEVAQGATHREARSGEDSRDRWTSEPSRSAALARRARRRAGRRAARSRGRSTCPRRRSRAGPRRSSRRGRDRTGRRRSGRRRSARTERAGARIHSGSRCRTRVGSSRSRSARPTR